MFTNSSFMGGGVGDSIGVAVCGVVLGFFVGDDEEGLAGHKASSWLSNVLPGAQPKLGYDSGGHS